MLSAKLFAMRIVVSRFGLGSITRCIVVLEFLYPWEWVISSQTAQTITMEGQPIGHSDQRHGCGLLALNQLHQRLKGH